MELKLKVKIINRNNWYNKSGDRYLDVVVFDEESRTKLVLLCEEENMSKLNKCKNGMSVKVEAKLKASNLGAYERNYIIIQDIVPA